MSDGCRACRAEADNLSISEAFVLGLMVADLQNRRRLQYAGTLCDRHGRFPHSVADRPREPVTVPCGTLPAFCLDDSLKP